MARTSTASPPALLVPRVLWLAMLAASGIYAALVGIPLIELPQAAADGTVLIALTGAAVACAVASFLVPPLMIQSALARQRFEVREVPDPGAPVGFRGAAPTVREYADVASVHKAARVLALTPMIVAFALSEAVSVLGLVLAMLGHPAQAWAPLLALGSTLIAIRFPTERALYGPIEKHTGVPVPR